MDVRTLCRTDTAMTNGEARKEWLKALSGCNQVAIRNRSHHTNTNEFVGLRWCMSRNIVPQGVNIKLIDYFAIDRPVLRCDQFRWLAVKEEYSDVLLYLVKCKAFELNDVDSYDMHPLVTAVVRGNIKNVKALLDAGANVNLSNKWGVTALTEACSCVNREGCVRLLLRSGADVNHLCNYGGTPLMMANYNDRVEYVQALLDTGADVNIVNTGNWTALMFAAKYKSLRCVELLLQQEDIRVNHATKSGITALKVAQQFRHDECIRLLLEAGGIKFEED